MESRAGRRKLSLAAWMESWELQAQLRGKGKLLEFLERERGKKEAPGETERRGKHLEREGRGKNLEREGIRNSNPALAQPGSQIHPTSIQSKGKDLELHQGRFSWILVKFPPRKVCQGWNSSCSHLSGHCPTPRDTHSPSWPPSGVSGGQPAAPAFCSSIPAPAPAGSCTSPAP